MLLSKPLIVLRVLVVVSFLTASRSGVKANLSRERRATKRGAGGVASMLTYSKALPCYCLLPKL